MKKHLLILLLLSLSTYSFSQVIQDIDGNNYKTVKIGNQLWMKENLKVIHYNNGDSIPNITNDSSWYNLITEGYCNYQNNNAYGSIYGKLYNHFTLADSRKLCPSRWHIPNNNDWGILFKFVNNNASNLIDTTKDSWESDYLFQNNESGFTALPGGDRGSEGDFQTIGYYGYWWSTTEKDVNDAWCMVLGYNRESYRYIGWFTNNKKCGFSVRCLCDSLSSISSTENDLEDFIYPNPVIDKLYFSNYKNDIKLLRLYDINGRLIMSTKDILNFVDISMLPSGLYMIEMVGSRHVSFNKIIKK